MARILLAEPDRQIRTLIAGILADCGHSVKACATVAEANAALATAIVDVVVTDLPLRRSGNTWLVRQFAALGIPTLTLSGRELHRGQPMAELPPSLLEKPFRFADLRGVLDAVMAWPEIARAADTAA